MFIVCKFGLWCGFDLVNSVGVFALLHCIVSSFVNLGVCLTLARAVVVIVFMLWGWCLCGWFVVGLRCLCVCLLVVLGFGLRIVALFGLRICL